MDKQTITTEEAPAAVGPYSQGQRARGLIFTAGQLGIVPGTKEFIGPDIESQTRQALENIGAERTRRTELSRYDGKRVIHIVYEITRDSFASGPLAG